MGPLQRKRQTEREKKKERNPSSFFLSEPKKCRWCKKKKESGGEGGCFLFRALPQQMFSGTGGRRGQTVKISKTLSCSSCLSLFYMPSALLSSCEKACLRPPLPPPPQKKRIIFLGRIRQVEKKEREREREKKGSTKEEYCNRRKADCKEKDEHSGTHLCCTYWVHTATHSTKTVMQKNGIEMHAGLMDMDMAMQMFDKWFVFLWQDRERGEIEPPMSDIGYGAKTYKA